MKYIKFILPALFLIVLFFGLFDVPGDEKRQFTTPDNRYTFKVINNPRFSNSIIDEIEDQINEAYPKIVAKYGEPTNGAKQLFIILNEGEAVSFAERNGLNLYFVKSNTRPLIHELVHVLYLNAKEPVSFFPLEGLAINVASENKEDKGYPHFGVPYHKVMNYLLQKDVYIPIQNFADINKSRQIMYVKEGSSEVKKRQWVAYVEAASFTRYLIDNYGVEIFMAIYAKSDLEAKVTENYGKSLSELEEEWLEFVYTEQNEFTIFDRVRYAIPINGFRINANGFVYE